MSNTVKGLMSLVIAAACTGYAAAGMAPAAAPAQLAAEEHKEKARELGSKEIAGYTVKVMQETDVKAGQEGAFAIALSGGKGKPKAIRGWVGVANAEGSVKAKALPEEDEWHCHVEVPEPIPDKSQFWVEIETDAGKKKAGFDYK